MSSVSESSRADQAAAWSRMSVQQRIPELAVTPDAMQIFMFSAVTWNRHHIHYSREAALAEGLPDVVVQRALLGNFLARLLTDWTGDAGAIRELSWKVVRSALPGQRLRCQGEVTAVEVEGSAQRIACALKVVDDGNITVAEGEALVQVESGE